MLNTKQKTGQKGEDIAVEYLKNKGYKILERNFKNKWGEIDIVAKKKKVIVFVEVKTLKQAVSFLPEDAVNKEKKKQLLKMVQIYLSHQKIPLDTPHRIDVVAVELLNNDQLKDIRHWENVIADWLYI